MKATLKNTYHRNGKVTFWNVYSQTWRKCYPFDMSDREMASMTETERVKLVKHGEKFRAKQSV